VFVLKFDAPRIQRVSIEGKNLIVSGDDFDAGAQLLMNGEEVKTRFTENPIRTAREKGCQTTSSGVEAKIRVRNSDETLSNEFGFTR